MKELYLKHNLKHHKFFLLSGSKQSLFVESIHLYYFYTRLSGFKGIFIAQMTSSQVVQAVDVKLITQTEYPRNKHNNIKKERYPN